MTVEELQEQILELQGQITTLTEERDASRTEATNLTDAITRLREINQQLFIRATQDVNSNNASEEEEEPTLEDVYKEIEW